MSVWLSCDAHGPWCHVVAANSFICNYKSGLCWKAEHRPSVWTPIILLLGDKNIHILLFCPFWLLTSMLANRIVKLSLFTVWKQAFGSLGRDSTYLVSETASNYPVTYLAQFLQFAPQPFRTPFMVIDSVCVQTMFEGLCQTAVRSENLNLNRCT